MCALALRDTLDWGAATNEIIFIMRDVVTNALRGPPTKDLRLSKKVVTTIDSSRRPLI
jgi:hypothetical protein